DTMNKPKIYFLYAFIAGLTLLPYEAFSGGDIEFNAVNNSGDDWCLQCQGPFSRQTPRVIVNRGGGVTHFYSAEISEFSPYGSWNCSLYQVDVCFLVGSEPDVTSGISVPLGTSLVELIIMEQQGITVIVQKFHGLEAESGSGLSVTSKLGNDPAPGARDVDTFKVSAEEGEELTIRLEGDPSAGYIGTYARLRLISDRRIGHIEEVEAGELPIEITTTIPETGTYEVIVGKIAQSDVPDNLLSFKGGYILSVDSADDKVEALIPAENVEH
ncbi:MAG TPA: hypothetical protein VLG45_00230, partial [Thermodesulfobacteriota bacterium]|nr:hypothetical protein [Thermodesulfobacteriota bacterium]